MSEHVIPESGGPYSLRCQLCGEWVPNTANHEMRNEGMIAYSHVCPQMLAAMTDTTDDAVTLENPLPEPLTGVSFCSNDYEDLPNLLRQLADYLQNMDGAVIVRAIGVNTDDVGICIEVCYVNLEVFTP